MAYEVRCECGKAHVVSAADAGSSLNCACGQTVDVPALHDLRLSAGQPGVAAEFLLRALLADGSLPDTNECQSCGEPTKRTIFARVDCERAEERPAEERPVGCFPLGIGMLVFYRTVREAEMRGRDVVFRIPVRCCSDCVEQLTNSDLRNILLRHHVCRGVLEKYPHARVTRAR